jgi:hypothetical protein
MGNCNSQTDSEKISAQEEYVNQRMKQLDMQCLSQMRGSMFHKDAPKYSNYQMKAYLRQEYHGRRDHDAYLLDSDLTHVGIIGKRVR